MSDAVLDALSAGAPAQASAAPAGDPVISALSSPAASSSTSSGGPPAVVYHMSEGPAQQFIEGAVGRLIGGTAGAAAGGLQSLWDLALGRGLDQAHADLVNTERAGSSFGAGNSAASTAGAAAASSQWNPLNWPGVAMSWAGDQLGSAAKWLGAGPVTQGLVASVPQAAATVLGLRVMAGEGAFTPYRVAAEEGTPAAADTQSISAAAADGGALPAGAPEPLGAPVEGGLSESAQAPRAATLARVGLTNARESAIEGDAQSAAVDYQMTRYDQPAGRAAAAQFQSEREALAAHAENLIGQTGGTIGMDEDALANRGATIARPFDMLRQWFNDRTSQLYAEADERSAAGHGAAYDTGAYSDDGGQRIR